MAPSGELQCLAEFLPSLSFEHMWILACSKGLYTICSKFLGHCHLFAVIDHEIKVLHSKPCQQEFTIRGSMTAELHPIPPSIFQKPAVSQKQWSKIIKSDDDEDCDSQGVGWRTREETRTLKFLPLEWSLGSRSAGGWEGFWSDCHLFPFDCSPSLVCTAWLSQSFLSGSSWALQPIRHLHDYQQLSK